MRRVLGIMLASAVAVGMLAGAGSSAPTTRTAAAPKNIVQVAAGNKQFSTLVALVKQAGLASTLAGKGPFTVFAPTNAAFANLKKHKPELYDQVTSDRALLRTVLTYHVASGRIPGTAALAVAKRKGTVKTVQGERISLSVRGGKIALDNAARVIIPDVKASNGVIHAIGAVLVPPSLSASPAPTQSIVEIAVGNPSFTTLVSLVQKAGLAATLAGPGPFTVFAPTNAAFEKLRAAAPATFAAVTSDNALLAKVLTYHALAGSTKSPAAIASAQSGGSVTTVQGEPIKLSLVGGKLTLNGASTVTQADILATNGVIHVIDTVLVPPSLAG